MFTNTTLLFTLLDKMIRSRNLFVIILAPLVLFSALGPALVVDVLALALAAFVWILEKLGLGHW